MTEGEWPRQTLLDPSSRGLGEALPRTPPSSRSSLQRGLRVVLAVFGIAHRLLGTCSIARSSGWRCRSLELNWCDVLNRINTAPLLRHVDEAGDQGAGVSTPVKTSSWSSSSSTSCSSGSHSSSLVFSELFIPVGLCRSRQKVS